MDWVFKVIKNEYFSFGMDDKINSILKYRMGVVLIDDIF
jgi:hypothetical protein